MSHHRLLVLTVAAGLFLLGSCTPKAPAAEAVPALSAPVNAPPAEAPQAVAPTSVQPVQKPQPAQPVRTATPVVPPRAFDESILRGREFLLSAPAPRVPLVGDPDLGALGTDPEVRRTVEAFVADAADGVLEAERLVPRWSRYLQAWAARFKTKALKWQAVRVGVPIESEGEGLLVPVKLSAPSATGFLGWMVLVRNEKGFIVSDVQLTESVPRTDPFDPESSGQLISSPSLR